MHSQNISKEIDQYASSYESIGDFSGYILITEKGETIYENCIGKADYSLNMEWTNNDGNIFEGIKE